jgi:glycosyltransferase involved in cell wall biosynthesis
MPSVHSQPSTASRCASLPAATKAISQAGPPAAASAVAHVEQTLQWVAQAVQETDSQSVRCAIPELTVVIPVYNEPHTVLTIVERVRALPIDKQILVVNDGSTDATPQSLAHLEGLPDVQVIHHDVNRGKGAALQTGFQQARGRFVIIQDADLEYDPGDILKVIAPLQAGQADVVYGSRYLEQPAQDPSRVHRFGNWVLTTFSNLLTGYRLTDMETCYKAFRRDLLSHIAIQQPRFGFEPEITAKLARHRARVQEVPVSYHSRGWDEGKKIGVKDLINTLYCIIRYAWFR